MGFFDLPILGALKTRIKWHSERQVMLAQNVANAETPGYRARDLAEPDFARLMRSGAPATGRPAFAPSRTQPMHLSGLSGSASFDDTRARMFERTPEGNEVILEEEMMKIAQNQMDHQMAVTIYSRGISMMKKAVGRSN